MPHTILYVEDEIAIIDLIHDVLNHPEIALISATTGSEGLAKAREINPDLLILDVMMPDRDGWSIYEEIRSDHRLKNMPIIMLTGIMHRYRIIKEFKNSPVDAYITKPFDAGEVRREVEKMLNRRFWVGKAEPVGVRFSETNEAVSAVPMKPASIPEQPTGGISVSASVETPRVAVRAPQIGKPIHPAANSPVKQKDSVNS